MRKFIRVMKAMSDPNRVRILKLLYAKELCVCEFQELLGLAQSTVSKHLKVLDDAQLIVGRREGAWMIYQLNKEPETEYAETMLATIDDWLNDDSEFRQMNSRLALVNRLEINQRQKK